MNVENVEAERRAALADVGTLAREACVHVFPGQANPQGQGAFWARPGAQVPRKQVPFDGDDDGFRRFNTDERDLHRVVVWCDQEPVLLAAKIRHELEHARQFDAHGPALFALYDLVDAALDVKVRGLIGGGFVYGSIPTEADANAAAARFAAGRYREEAARLVQERHIESNLLRSHTGPAPLATLPGRMVAFAYEVADLGERYFRVRGFTVTFADAVDQFWAGAADAWSALERLNAADS